MQLQIRHETRYVYEDTVSYSIQSLRLTPRSDAGQRIVSWRIHTPGQRIEQVDAYGNLTHIVTVEVAAPRIAHRGRGRGGHRAAAGKTSPLRCSARSRRWPSSHPRR